MHTLFSLQPRPHRQQCRSNIVECYKLNDSFDKVECCFDKVEHCFDIVAVFANNIERVFREISSFRQSRNEWNMFNLFTLSKGQNFVWHRGNNVETTFHFVKIIVRLLAFDNVASALLLVWTGLNGNKASAYRQFRQFSRSSFYLTGSFTPGALRCGEVSCTARHGTASPSTPSIFNVLD